MEYKLTSLDKILFVFINILTFASLLTLIPSYGFISFIPKPISCYIFAKLAKEARYNNHYIRLVLFSSVSILGALATLLYILDITLKIAL